MTEPANDQDKARAAEAAAQAPQGALRVVNFMADVLKDSPEVKAIFENLEALAKLAVVSGFPEDQARRAIDLWLMDLAWTHLLNGTSTKQNTFFALTGAPIIVPPAAGSDVLGSNGPPLAPSQPPAAPQGDEQPDAPDAVATAAGPGPALDVIGAEPVQTLGS